MASRRMRTGALALALAVSTAIGASSPALAKGSPEETKQRIASTQQAQAAVGNRLTSGQSLTGQDFLRSTSGQHELWADEDLYVISGSGGLEFLTGDAIPPEGTQKLIMQGDGNLVLYIDGKAFFHTRTFGNPGASVVMQDDGNVVVYSSAGKALWASRTIASYGSAFRDGEGDLNGYLRPGWYLTSPNGRYRLVMQGDGNLVLYSGSGAIWHTRTHGNPGAFFAIQGDGNLVVYSAGKALWNSGSVRSVEYVELQVQNNGNVVNYGWSGTSARVLWQSGTAGR